MVTYKHTYPWPSASRADLNVGIYEICEYASRNTRAPISLLLHTNGVSASLYVVLPKSQLAYSSSDNGASNGNEYDPSSANDADSGQIPVRILYIHNVYRTCMYISENLRIF